MSNQIKRVFGYFCIHITASLVFFLSSGNFNLVNRFSNSSSYIETFVVGDNNLKCMTSAAFVSAILKMAVVNTNITISQTENSYFKAFARLADSDVKICILIFNDIYMSTLLKMASC